MAIIAIKPSRACKIATAPEQYSKKSYMMKILSIFNRQCLVIDFVSIDSSVASMNI